MSSASKASKSTTRSSARKSGRSGTKDSPATVGSYAQVWHGTAKRTPGGLTKSDLVKVGDRIVSRRRREASMKRWRTMMSDPSFKAKWDSQKKSK